LVITGKGFKKIEIVNFYNPFRTRNSNVGRDAIRSAEVLPKSTLRVVHLHNLIALKLYGGGPGSR
jgi:hypothetical protein